MYGLLRPRQAKTFGSARLFGPKEGVIFGQRGEMESGKKLMHTLLVAFLGASHYVATADNKVLYLMEKHSTPCM